jgi:hypothetical protein
MSLNDVISDGLYTAEEAKKHVRKWWTNRSIGVHAGVSLYTTPERDTYFPGGAIVWVSHENAIKFITDALSPILEGKGGRIRVVVYPNCIFIG